MTNIKAIFYLLFTAVLMVSCGPEPEPGFTIESAWVRPLPPAAKMTAGYFDITNTGGSSRTITGASSPDFSSVSLHQTVVSDGVARMQEIPSQVIKAGERISFEPGGRHLMLMGSVNNPLGADCCTLTLTFSEGPDVTFQARIGRGPR